MASGATAAAANIGMTIAKRPNGPGTAGRPVELKANFIAVSEFKFPKVHYYSFEVTERKKKAGKKDSARVFEQMKLKKKFGSKVVPVFDGGQLYSSEQLDIGHSKTTRNHEIKISDGGREKEFRVEVKYQGDIELSHIGDYVKVDSDKNWDGQIQNNLTVLNAFANSKVRSLHLSVGKKAIFPPLRDQYNNPTKILLSGGVEMKQGFYQSIRPGWGKLIINVDICAATFYPDGPIISILPKLFKNNKMSRHERTPDELRRGLDKKENDALNWFLKGVMIYVTHRSDNRKPKYKVTYVDSQPADSARFRHNNRDITVSQYFKETYGRNLQYGRLPCIVVVKPDRSRVYFPLEVCEIVPGQKYEVNKLSEDARREMVQKTAIRPYERFERIGKAIKDIFQHDKDENLRSIGLSVKPEFIKVKGRVLQPPKLTTQTGEITPQEGRWDLKKYLRCPKLVNWSVIVFESKNYAPLELIRNSIKQLCTSLSERGMDVVPNPPIEYGNPHGGYEKSLLLAAQRARINKDHPVQLIICVIQKKVMGISGIHASIKRVCGTQLGVISQCIVLSNMKGPNPGRWRQICGNISLKINGKLGGKNFALADKELNFETNKPYMVFGADVFHPGREEKGRPSVAAVCASVDKSVTKYISRYSMNRKIKNETIENLEGMVVELLRQFQLENNLLPYQIVFYRDGVAEGQFQHVVNMEVEALKRAFNRVYISKSQQTQKPQLPQLTFIIVQKRHHARFMPVQKGDSDRSGNCRPGTIVDTEIVVPQEFDFYLQSHASPLGTARPTHYNVLLNEAKFSVDAIQTLTYKLCHLSARCNLAISHVTPVHYAHNIANQVKHFVTWDGGRSGSSGGSGGRGGDMVPNTTKCEKLKPEIENQMFFV